MPPKKRKASDVKQTNASDNNNENDGAINPTPLKKSKKEERLKAKERARQWAKARKQGTPKTSAKTPTSTVKPKTAAAPSNFIVPEETYGTSEDEAEGKDENVPETKTPKVLANGIADKSRKPAAANQLVAKSTVPKNTDRATGPSGTPVQSPKFNLATTPMNSSPADLLVSASVGDKGSGVATQFKTPRKVTNDPEETENEAQNFSIPSKVSVPSTSKARKQAAVERARAWLEEKQQKDSDRHTAKPPAKKIALSTDSKNASLASSPDPPESVPASDKPSFPSAASTVSSVPSAVAPYPHATAETAVAAAETSRTTTTTAPPTSTAPASTRSIPTKSTPPEALASLFSTQKRSVVHRPALKAASNVLPSKGSTPAAGKPKFDPNQPWPPVGYKLPTAAYCGCGPTPFSRTTTVRPRHKSGPPHLASMASRPENSDLCTFKDGPSGAKLHGIVMAAPPAYGSSPYGASSQKSPYGDSSTLGVGGSSSSYSIKRKESMRDIPPVDPPHQNFFPKESNMPTKPSPPGATAAEIDVFPASACTFPATPKMPTPAMSEAPPKLSQKSSVDCIDTSVIERNNPSSSGPPPSAPSQMSTSAPVIESMLGEENKANAANPTPLNASVARASALVATAARVNQQRREGMGIRSLDHQNEEPNKLEPAEISHLGGDMLQEKGPVDPPIGSISIPAVICSPSSSALLTVKTTQNSNELENEVVHTNSTVESSEKSLVMETAGNISLLAKAIKLTGRIIYFFMLLLVMVTLFVLAARATFWVGNFETKLLSNFLSPFNGTLNLPKETELDSPIERSEDTACFIDHPAGFYPDKDFIEVNTCDGQLRECPSWGRCHGGRLRDCLDGGSEYEGISRFIPNQREDACTPSPEAVELAESVTKSILGMSSAQTCNSWDAVEYPDVVWPESDLFPMFSLAKVAENSEQRLQPGSSLKNISISPRLLLWLKPVFDPSTIIFGSSPLVDGDNVDFIGLAPSIPPSSLPLPVGCAVKLMVWESVDFFGRLVTSFASHCVKISWKFITNYPLLSSFTFLMLILLIQLRCRQHHRSKVRELLAVVLESVYDRLAECEDNEGYAALLLRDDVGHEMYPTNVRERLFMYDEVWPRVVVEVHADNRIRKFRKMANGKELEHWEFATQSKRGRKLRRSLGASREEVSSSKRGEGTTKQIDHDTVDN